MDGMKKGQDAATPYKPGETPKTAPPGRALPHIGARIDAAAVLPPKATASAAQASIAAGQKAADSFLNATQEPTLGSFKHGGIVPKTGNYKLHEGEKVIPMANEEKMAESLETGKKKETKSGEKRESKVAKKKEGEKPTVHHMSIHKVKGGHIVHHHYAPHEEGDGRKPDATHVVPNGPGGEGDVDNLHNHIEEHMGAPNAGEDQMAAGAAPEAPAVGPAPAMANLAPAGA